MTINEIEKEIKVEIEVHIDGEIEDFKNDVTLSENQEVHGELIVQKSHEFFEEIEYVDFIGIIKFDYFAAHPLL